MDNDVPLIVPEVNLDQLQNYKKKNIIANKPINAVPATVIIIIFLKNPFGIPSISGESLSLLLNIYMLCNHAIIKLNNPNAANIM